MTDNVKGFRLLGQLQVWNGSQWVTIPAAQQRVVLAILLCEAGRVVSTDRLIEELWGDDPPDGALNTVQAYVMRLRRMLGDRDAKRLVTRRPGYQMVVDDSQLDARMFQRHTDAGLQALAGGQLERAIDELSQGLALWHGPALADVTATATVAAAAGRLEQLRLSAVEARIDADMDLGRHERVVAELEQLVAEHPLRERLRGRLMVALYRCGRRADALEVYRRGRIVLIDELGIEPGPDLAALQQGILNDDPRLRGPTTQGGRAQVDGTGAAASPQRSVDVPAQLPAASPAFVGRAEHLRHLDALLGEARNDGGGTTVVVSAIAGAAGVGKTALAVHWAHRVRDHFPDGQLYIDLRGHAAATPRRPLEALTAFLTALGVPPERVPVDVEQAAALFRTMLADKRTLVVLDNAGSAEQVRPLLPGGGGCLVLVTSRQRLGGLVAREGARRLTLDVLAAQEAGALLERMLGAERVRGEPEAAAELARLCGHLPLALRIAAAILGEHPTRRLAEHNTELRADRLTALAVEGDEEAAVRAVFALSYAGLPPEARRLFRLLGLLPGRDATADAAAALAGATSAEAQRLLGQLHDAHLVIQHTAGRYTFHDLLRLYAGERAQLEETATARDAALQRLLTHYLRTADTAARLLYPDKLRIAHADHGTPAGPLDEPNQARTWFDAERRNLVAAIEHAAEHGPRRVGWLLADTLRGYFWLCMRTVEWIAAATAGLAAATADGATAGRAAAHLSLGDAHRCQSRYTDAIDHYEQAQVLSHAASWIDGQAAALGNLGNTCWRAGRPHDAAEQLTLALELDRRTGRLEGQAASLANLANVYLELGRLREAADHIAEALALDTQLGAEWSRAIDLTSVGEVRYALGHLDDARAALAEALSRHRELDDRDMEAVTLQVLAAVQCASGDHGEAARSARSALTLTRATGNRRTEAETLNTLARVDAHGGRLDQAIDLHRRAIAVATATSERYPEVVALTGLATVEGRLGHNDTARRHGEQALALARSAGYRLLEGNALTALASITLAADDPRNALDFAHEALELHHGTGHRLGEARTLVVLGHALWIIDGPGAATPYWQRALALFTASGSTEAGEVRALIEPAGAR